VQNDHLGIFGAYGFDIPPHPTKVSREVVRAGMNDLMMSRVVDNVGDADEPITEPLVGNIGPHAVVKARALQERRAPFLL